ncbi:MAG: hypothetical protein PHU46_08630 [Rhodocyclaceae bacterium]|nr:hypothetical protein [Rhodocyclaceae bacterium]
MPFLIDLNVEERKGMARFGDKSQSFVAKAADLAAQHPEILPPSFDRQGLLDEMALLEALTPLRHALQVLLGRVDDTLYALGSDSYSGALHVYSYAKTANMVTGALEDAMDDLGKRFLRRSSARPSTQSPQA